MDFISPNLRAEKLDSAARKKKLRLYTVAVIIFVALLCSCSASNYGKLQTDQDVTRVFQTAQVLHDHSYFFSGLEGVPDAIIAIHPNYTLRDKFWQEINFSHETLKKWIYRMSHVRMVAPRGAWILGPQGDRLGIWFSSQHQTAVRLDRTNRVMVAPPQPPQLKGVP